MKKQQLFFENNDITNMSYGMNYGDGNAPEPGFDEEYAVAVYCKGGKPKEVLKNAEFSRYWEFCEWLNKHKEEGVNFSKSLWFFVKVQLDQWGSMPTDPATGDRFVLPGAIQVTGSNGEAKGLRLHGVDGLNITSQRLVQEQLLASYFKEHVIT